jgi:hypothetical protein
MSYFAIRMFPASEGDCLVVEYGDQKCPTRLLIDGGRLSTYNTQLSPFLQSLPAIQQQFKLFVVTHVDRDHIEGALALITDPSLTTTFEDVWFNDYLNLVSDDPPQRHLGAEAGERLSYAIRRRGWHRNKAFYGGAASTRDGRILPKVKLGDELAVTLLSPDRGRLERLIPIWDKECIAAGIEPGRFVQEEEEEPMPILAAEGSPDPPTLASVRTPIDDKAANGTSIAFLVEYEGHRVLFGSDAHPDLLADALGKLGYGPDNPIELDAYKVSHHGSRRNTTSALLACMRTSRYLVSTNGAQTKHPNVEAIARLVTAAGPPRTILFNYRTKFNELWDRDDWKIRYRYQTCYGDGKTPMLVAIP